MSDLPLSMPMSEARRAFGSLVRRAAGAGERFTITDHGRPAAVLVNPQELADLEEAVSLAEYRADQASGGTPRLDHGKVRSRLGL